MKWNTFDADKPDPAFEASLDSISIHTLATNGIAQGDKAAIASFIEKQLADYGAEGNEELNQIVATSVFRPHEFDSVQGNDDSLKALLDWLAGQVFDWRNGSEVVNRRLANVFPAAGSRRVKGGREYVTLDALVSILERRVAIEVETSINIDNGYWSLRQAVRSKAADYGVMVVNLVADASGRADDAKATGRLDREFEGSAHLADGPIYRITLVRRLDILRRMRKRT
jgi:hypothetical protein